jgi:hypothetical protein
MTIRMTLASAGATPPIKTVPASAAAAVTATKERL